MIEFPKVLEERLSEAKKQNQIRSLKLRRGLDFSSNDYLAFTQDSLLQEKIRSTIEKNPSLCSGATGSRLLRGHLEVFEKLESRLANFSGFESSLFFPTGYQANLGLYSAVLSPDDLVFSDEFNHASIIDGIKLSKAKVSIFSHNSISNLEDLLEKSQTHSGLKVVATESLFSMEGDEAPLQDLAKLCKRYGALLIVDEAHATGLFGSGLTQKLGLTRNVFATLHGAGKALGAQGAWIACSQNLKDYLVNFSRPFIFSTAPSPLMAGVLNVCLDHWTLCGEERAKKVLGLAQRLYSNLKTRQKEFQFEMPNISGALVPVILGSSLRAMEVAEKLQNLEIDVRAIRPPTVSEGKSRLRITLNSNHSETNVDHLSNKILELLGDLK